MTHRFPAAAMCAIALALTLLAGCSSGPSAGPTTHLRIDFGGAQPTRSADVPFDASARPADSYYKAHGTAHAAYTAFDQLAQWASTAGVPLNVSYTQYGDCLGRINGLPAVGSCDKGATAYWSLSLNGGDAMEGMDTLALHANDTVAWTLTQITPMPTPTTGTPTSAPATPSQPSAWTITAPVEVLTKSATAWVNGTSNAGHRLSLNYAGLSGQPTTNMTVGEGTFSLRIDGLAVGGGNLTLYVDDGANLVRHTTRVVRLGHATFAVDYKNVKTSRSDDVWFDPTNYTSAPLYAGKDVAHPAYYTAHDLMATWSAQTAVPVVTSYFSGIGYFVNAIDSVGTPSSVGDTTGVGPWCYDVNGTSAPKGISTMDVHDGDAIAWALGCA